MRIVLLSIAALVLENAAARASTIQNLHSAAGSVAPASGACSNCNVDFGVLERSIHNYASAYTNADSTSGDEDAADRGNKYQPVGTQGGTLQYSLVLDRSLNYFGLWFSTANPRRRVELYAGNTLISAFSASEIDAPFSGCSDSPTDLSCGTVNASRVARVLSVSQKSDGASSHASSSGPITDSMIVEEAAVLAPVETPEPSTGLLVLIPIALALRRRSGFCQHDSGPAVR